MVAAGEGGKAVPETWFCCSFCSCKHCQIAVNLGVWDGSSCQCEHPLEGVDSVSR
jgi:hypothetical protein